MKISYYIPTENRYTTLPMSFSWLNGALEGGSNELIFDFDNNIVYLNDTDTTETFYNALNREISSLENITAILVSSIY
jgi:hypothetical protein